MTQHPNDATSARRDAARHANGRAWLDVPYAEKDAAKALGARWDPTAKRWYDPRPPTAGLHRWAARPADVPDLLPGEDRAFGSGLFVDMVPRTCWFTNVRTCVTQQDWERLRRMITRRAGHRCETCGAAEDRARRLWLEAHERWAYNDKNGVQALRRLICLCSACHLATHFGHANVTGRTREAFDHLCQVTGMTPSQADHHIAEAGQLWTTRSARTWQLDLSTLTDAGVTLIRPEAPSARARTADRELAAHQRPAGRRPSRMPQPTPPPMRHSAPRPIQRSLPRTRPNDVRRGTRPVGSVGSPAADRCNPSVRTPSWPRW